MLQIREIFCAHINNIFMYLYILCWKSCSYFPLGLYMHINLTDITRVLTMLRNYYLLYYFIHIGFKRQTHNQANYVRSIRNTCIQVEILKLKHFKKKIQKILRSKLLIFDINLSILLNWGVLI